MLTFRNEVCFYLAYTENIASADLTRFAPTAKIIIYKYFSITLKIYHIFHFTLLKLLNIDTLVRKRCKLYF